MILKIFDRFVDEFAEFRSYQKIRYSWDNVEALRDSGNFRKYYYDYYCYHTDAFPVSSDAVDATPAPPQYYIHDCINHIDAVFYCHAFSYGSSNDHCECQSIR